MTEERIPLDSARATQRGAILRLLIAAKGDWVSLLEIRERAPQYNARIFELRRLGLRIENKIRDIGGKRLSWFRLLNSPKHAESVNAAPDSPARALTRDPKAATEEPSLFGSLAPGRRYPD
jgi:hypothetical protein